MNEGPSRQYRKLTRQEVFKVMHLLHQNLIELKPGLYVYTRGFSDQVVMEQSIPDFPGDALKAVKQIRRDEFGELCENPDDGGDLQIIMRRFARLCEQLGVRPEDLDG